MKIIDFIKKGNVIRFLLGEETEDWGWVNPDYKDYTGKTPDWLAPCNRFYGDDWDDAPYEYNAGQVYEEFVKGKADVAFTFDTFVLEPRDTFNRDSSWCKDDMRDRKVPCLVIVPKDVVGEDVFNDNFDYWLGNEGALKIYIGDPIEKLTKHEFSRTIFSYDLPRE